MQFYPLRRTSNKPGFSRNKPRLFRNNPGFLPNKPRLFQPEKLFKKKFKKSTGNIWKYGNYFVPLYLLRRTQKAVGGWPE